MNISLLGTIFGGLGIASTLIFIIAMYVVITRTHSNHALVFRLWQLAIGKNEVTDEKVQLYLNEQMSLMSFRFMSGIRPQRIEGAHRLIDWSKVHRVNLELVGAAGRHFDCDKMNINPDSLPSGKYQIVKMGAVAIIGLLILCSALAMRPNAAVVSFNDGGTTFLLSEYSVRRFWPLDSLVMNKSNCKPPVAKNYFGFKAEEQRIICAAWITPEWKQIVKDKVTSQRFSLAIIIISLLFFASFPFMSFRRGVMAKKLLAVIKENQNKMKSDNKECLDDGGKVKISTVN